MGSVVGGRWKRRVFLYKCSSELQSQRDLISWIQLSGPHDFLPRFRVLQSVLCLQRFLFLSLRIQQCSCSFKSETQPFQSSRPFRGSHGCCCATFQGSGNKKETSHKAKASSCDRDGCGDPTWS